MPMYMSAHVYLSGCMNMFWTHVKGSTVQVCSRFWLLPAAMVTRRNSHLGEDTGLEVCAELGNNNHQKYNCEFTQGNTTWQWIQTCNYTTESQEHCTDSGQSQKESGHWSTSWKRIMGTERKGIHRRAMADAIFLNLCSLCENTMTMNIQLWYVHFQIFILINNTLLLILLIVKTKVQGHTSNWETWLWRLHSGWLEDRAWQSRGEEYRLSLLGAQVSSVGGPTKIPQTPRNGPKHKSLIADTVDSLSRRSLSWLHTAAFGGMLQPEVPSSLHFLFFFLLIFLPIPGQWSLQAKQIKPCKLPSFPKSKNASSQQLTN